MIQFALHNKNIIVTGASSGIGQQCAISCSKMGARVILIGRNEERLQETLQQMDSPEKHVVCSVDLTNFDKVSEAISSVIEKVDCIHGVIHSAGTSVTLPLKVVTKEKLDSLFQTNVYSAYNLTKEVCKVGRFAKEGGSIIFFSSVMGSVGETAKSLYAMTKGALVAGTKSLACELAKKKIRVNTISPGAIITPINENSEHISNPEKRQKLEEKHLLGLGTTEDVANACIYLLSDASRWVTGTNLFVDGGYTCQ